MDNSRGNGQDASTATVEDNDRRKGGRGCGPWILLLLVLLGGAGLGGGLMGMTVLREETPLPGEQVMADFAARTLAMPGEYADKRIPNRPKVSVANGKELFKVECSMCHGEGRGDTQLGQTMYPPAADLTSVRTQSKSPGQLYWIIAHGINLTGMPGFGKDFGVKAAEGGQSWLGIHDEDELWSLVSYVKSLNTSK